MCGCKLLSGVNPDLRDRPTAGVTFFETCTIGANLMVHYIVQICIIFVCVFQGFKHVTDILYVVPLSLRRTRAMLQVVQNAEVFHTTSVGI